MNRRDIIIAIDGHSSTGKSTLAKRIAHEYNLIYVDTGALYRGITFAAVKAGIAPEQILNDGTVLGKLLAGAKFHFIKREKDGASELYMNDLNIEREIRTLEVASRVSLYASVPKVREYVNSILMGYRESKGVVMDGRDIGTVVLPNAHLKIFMTADAKIRAQRRFLESRKRGENPNFEEVLKNVKERDFLDENRVADPLRKAEDAILLDNSYMTEDEEMIWIERIMKERWG